MIVAGGMTKAYLSVGPTDMRNSFQGLAAAVRTHMQRDPLSGEAYAFCNRRRTLVKILVWDGTGLWVHAKRLAQGTFSWPTDGDHTRSMTREELALILGGIDAMHTTQRRWYRREVAG